MSAVISLYRLSDAKFQNKGFYSMSNDQRRQLTEDEFDALWETKDSDRFEDGKARMIVDITKLKSMYGSGRGWKKIRDKFAQLPIQSGIVDCTKDTHNYIVADSLGHFSGQCLNKKYYNKDTLLTLCTTKEEVIMFFGKYGDKDHKIVLNQILEQWDEKTFMLIEMATAHL